MLSLIYTYEQACCLPKFNIDVDESLDHTYMPVAVLGSYTCMFKTLCDSNKIIIIWPTH